MCIVQIKCVQNVNLIVLIIFLTSTINITIFITFIKIKILFYITFGYLLEYNNRLILNILLNNFNTLLQKQNKQSIPSNNKNILSAYITIFTILFLVKLKIDFTQNVISG